MATYYYLGADGKVYGPANVHDLGCLLRQGAIEPEAYIIPEGAQDWETLRESPIWNEVSAPVAPEPVGPAGDGAPRKLKLRKGRAVHTQGDQGNSLREAGLEHDAYEPAKKGLKLGKAQFESITAADKAECIETRKLLEGNLKYYKQDDTLIPFLKNDNFRRYTHRKKKEYFALSGLVTLLYGLVMGVFVITGLLNMVSFVFLTSGYVFFLVGSAWLIFVVMT